MAPLLFRGLNLVLHHILKTDIFFQIQKLKILLLISAPHEWDLSALRISGLHFSMLEENCVICAASADAGDSKTITA